MLLLLCWSVLSTLDSCRLSTVDCLYVLSNIDFPIIFITDVWLPVVDVVAIYEFELCYPKASPCKDALFLRCIWQGSLMLWKTGQLNTPSGICISSSLLPFLLEFRRKWFQDTNSNLNLTSNILHSFTLPFCCLEFCKSFLISRKINRRGFEEDSRSQTDIILVLFVLYLG